MAVRAMDLFKAYHQNSLPKEGGFIVSTFFDSTSAYSRYEIVAYSAVKNIFLSEDNLTFRSDGNKLYLLAEPPSYPRKHVEPINRAEGDQVPHRFAELEVLTAKNQTRIMISREPVSTYSSFTVLKPTGHNFAFIFYNSPEVIATIGAFFEKTLNQEANIPQNDAKKAAELVIQGLGRFTILH